jgi:hypothetical protein
MTPRLVMLVARIEVNDNICHTRTSRQLVKNYLSIGKGTDIWYFVLLGKNVLFKELSPSIMVTRNPN